MHECANVRVYGCACTNQRGCEEPVGGQAGGQAGRQVSEGVGRQARVCVRACVRACVHECAGMQVCGHEPARVRGACLRVSRRGCVCMRKYVHECAGVQVCGRAGMCA